MMMRLGLATLLAAGLASFGGCSGGDDDDDAASSSSSSTGGGSSSSGGGSSSSSGGFQQPADVEAGSATTLDVENAYGSVDLTGESRTSVHVVATFTGQDVARAGEITVTSALSGSALQVRVIYPASNPPNVVCNLAISAPAGLAPQVSTQAGAITHAHGTAGGTHDTAAGAITVVDGAGAFSATSQAGAINLGLTGTVAALSATSASGNVALTLPAATNANLSATTTLGTITITGITLTGTNTGTTASGQFGTGGPTLTLQSTTGDITITGQ
ncbi:MAG: DUF4097 family beta strand repeat protein [Deltaproteobacteria bacterium]|nr:DUF4097 family beta strand repeat protein [Deltaproteobacteria bacterium]